MAGTITPNLTDISLCESATGWSLGTADVDSFIQGAACITYTYATAGDKAALLYTLASPIDMTDVTLYLWITFARLAMLNTAALGGLRFHAEDASGYWSEWTVGGKDTLSTAGWAPYCVRTNQTPDYTSGTLNKAAVTKVGFKVYLLIKGIIKWDAFRYGTGLTVTAGTEAAPCTFADIQAAEDDVNKKYGVLTKFEGVYYVQGRLIFGDSAGTTATYFKDTSQIVIFKDVRIGDLPEIRIVGNTTGTTKVFFGIKSGTAGISGCIIKSAGTVKFKFTATDTNITNLGLYGSSLLVSSTISLPAYSVNKEVLNTIFENCAEVLANTCIMTNCNFISSAGRAIRISSASHNVTSCNFINCQTAIHHDTGGAVGTPLHIDYNSLMFTGGTYHIENSAVTPNFYIDIDRIGTPVSNPDPAKINNSNGGSTTLLEIGVPLEINGVKTGTEPTNYVRCRIEKQSDNSTIMNQEAQTAYGTEGFYKATMTYSYIAEVPVRVRARYKGYLPFEANATIKSTGMTVTAIWLPDPNYAP